MISTPDIPPPPPPPEPVPPPPAPAPAGRLKPISAKAGQSKRRGKSSLVIPRPSAAGPSSGSKAAGISMPGVSTSKSPSGYGMSM